MRVSRLTFPVYCYPKVLLAVMVAELRKGDDLDVFRVGHLDV